MSRFKLLLGVTLLTCCGAANAALVTDPNDPRSWQAATVGTFATLYYGSNTTTTRQQVVDNQLLDDGHFNGSGYSAATLVKFNGGAATSGGYGESFDKPGVADAYDGSYGYGCCASGANVGANAIDAYWVQTDSVVGNTVFDLGFQASRAAVFNTIDHGPLPWEAIESTVYLSNDMLNWVQAVTQRVWLEGIYADHGVVWDGFVYAVGAPNGGTFRYASVIWGGPGALQADGDNEINGLLGLRSNYEPGPGDVPEPASLGLLGLGLAGLAGLRRRKR